MTQQNNSTTPREREYIRMRNLLSRVFDSIIGIGSYSDSHCFDEPSINQGS
jgi:hypothetical protein